MKKFRIESKHKIYTKRFRTMQEAIEFKNTLCKFQNWIIKEVTK